MFDTHPVSISTHHRAPTHDRLARWAASRSSRIVALVLAASLSAALGGCKKAGGKENNKAEVVPVKVEPAVRRAIVEQVYLAGEVTADVEVKVFSLIAQRLLRVTFDEGQFVKKGKILAEVKAGALYDAVHQAKAGLRAAKTQLKLAKIERDRTKKLYKSGALPIATLQRAEAQYDSAQAQVAQMQAIMGQSYSNISNVTIRAPVSGLIGQKFLNKGDTASPQMPLCTIVQMDRVRIKAAATELDLVRLSKGQPATVTVPAYPNRAWKGKVDYIAPVLDRATRTATITIIVDNPKHELRPGMFADVQIEVGRREGVIMVKALAVARYVAADETVHHRVFLVDGDKVKAQDVVIGERQDDFVEIRKGLDAGQRIVVLGVFRLRDGSHIKIIKDQPAPPVAVPTQTSGSRPRVIPKTGQAGATSSKPTGSKASRARLAAHKTKRNRSHARTRPSRREVNDHETRRASKGD
ncbi:MAG: efflux RND transporter periplasmic adaptor subunit [Deltaproteobacteria bacterium]|nr:efflux RND transporter periplasmic adaptor subunit [Deltaproteobacteria bacterium]